MNKRPMYHRMWVELSNDKSMVLLAGPRQVGKTTFAKSIAQSYRNSLYHNWDIFSDRKRLTEHPYFFKTMERVDASRPLVILDEIHKYRQWKNYLKGAYDAFQSEYQFLVLGSGRLNVFQKGGDSLAGRYSLFTLWPLTIAELSEKQKTFEDFLKNPLSLDSFDPSAQKVWEQMAHLSGFPEPFFSGSRARYGRWAGTYRQQLIREDIRNLTQIRDIDAVELLFSLLRTKIGSPLSLNSLSRDLQVSPKSITHWLSVFERYYLCFRIAPWSRRVTRAILKEKKLYLYDYASIPSDAARFENMVALELMRATVQWTEYGWGEFSLRYLRTKEKEEVDFLIVKDNQPFLLIETKLSERTIAPSLRKFQTLLGIPAIQLVSTGNTFRRITQGSEDILVANASQWLSGLP